MKLYANLTSPYARKVRIVLAEKRIDYELELVDLTQGGDVPLAGVNPLGKVPALVLDDGTSLYDSRVIVEFLDNASPIMRLIPDENRDRAAVRRWEALADGVLDAGILVRGEALRPEKKRDAAFAERQRGKLERGIATMSDELGDRLWCHGIGCTLADVALGAALGWVAFRHPGIDWRVRHANLARHYDKLMERAAFAETAPPPA